MAIEIRDGVEGKRCSTCRKWKPLSDFYSDPSHPASQGRRHCRCKDCYKAGRKQQRAALQAEIRRHDVSHFIDEPPSVAERGESVVVPGCPTCRKRINTMPQFLDDLADDVLPGLLDTLSTDVQLKGVR